VGIVGGISMTVGIVNGISVTVGIVGGISMTVGILIFAETDKIGFVLNLN
jgi:hypothetical protein